MTNGNNKLPLHPIDKEILKAYSKVNINKKKVICQILNKLKIDNIFKIEYRSIDFSPHALIKAIIFMKLKNLNQSNLKLYLNNNTYERKKLNLERAPDQSMISYFYRNKLTDEHRHFIEIIVKRIEEVAGKKRVCLDCLNSQLKKGKKKKTNTHYKRKMKTHEVSKLFKKRILPHIYFNLKKNCCYDTKDFINFLIYLTRESDFAENGADTYRLELKQKGSLCPDCRTKMISDIDLWNIGKMSLDIGDNYFLCPNCGKKKRILPTGGTLRHQLKNYEDKDQIIRMYLNVFEVLWNMIPNSVDFKNKPTTIAIDKTKWLYWGEKKDEYVKSGQYKNGTKYSYEFITLDIVQAGKRFTILALPFTNFSSRNKLVKQLLEFARQRIKISLVLMDREFFNIKDQMLLRSLRLNYIIPVIEFSNVKKVLKVVSPPFILSDVPMGKNDFSYTMAVIDRINDDGKSESHAFATNIVIDESNPENEAKRIANLYRQRWGIETGYRVKAHTFRPKTSSNDHIIRIFYFYFSILMYNLWILADMLIWLSLSNTIGVKHMINAKFFRKHISLIDPGG